MLNLEKRVLQERIQKPIIDKQVDKFQIKLDKTTTPILTSEKANICEVGLVENEYFLNH